MSGAVLVGAALSGKELYDYWKPRRIGIYGPTMVGKTTLDMYMTTPGEMEDIPEAVLRYLGAKKPIPKDASAAEVRAIKKRNKALWTGEQTILEMTGLRSKLGEIAAAARNEKRWNAARIAERIRTAILDDLVYMGETQVGEIGKAFRMATDYSRHLNKTFNEGPVSKILGTSKIGDVTPESLTLESLARKE